MNAPPEPLQFALVLLVAVAAIYDWRFRRIPNWLVVTGFCSGVSLQTALFGWRGLKEAALGCAAAFAVYFVLFALRAMGGGDVKLMAAIGSMTGPSNWLNIFILASVLGGIIAVVLILSRGTLTRTLRNVLSAVRNFLRLKAPYRENPELDISHPQAVTLPHGISIALGCFLFLVLANVGG